MDSNYFIELAKETRAIKEEIQKLRGARDKEIEMLKQKHAKEIEEYKKNFLTKSIEFYFKNKNGNHHIPELEEYENDF